MIVNEHQYRVTQQRLAEYEAILQQGPPAGVSVEPAATALLRRSMESQAEDLRQQLAEYEARRRQAHQVPSN